MADSRATEDLLAALHGTVCRELIDKLKSGEATAADISVAVKFLKDNGITAVPGEKNDLGKLAASLPDLDSLDANLIQ